MPVSKTIQFMQLMYISKFRKYTPHKDGWKSVKSKLNVDLGKRICTV